MCSPSRKDQGTRNVSQEYAAFSDIVIEAAIDPLRAATYVVLSWLTQVDREVHAEEAKIIEAVGSELGVASAQLFKLAETGHPREIAVALGAVRLFLRETDRVSFLQLCIALTVADGVFRFPEMMALALVADAVAPSSTSLVDVFREVTGRELPVFGDMSSAKVLEELQRKSENRRRESNSRSRKSGDSDSDPRDRASGAGSRKQDRGAGRANTPNSAREALAILGLDEGASSEEIKDAYRRLVQVHHPDKFSQLGPEASKMATTVFLRIQSAYELLRQ